MKFALVFVMCLAATQAFHLGHLFHNIGHAIHNVGHDIHNDVKKVGDDFKNFGEHIQSLAKDAKNIPEEVINAVKDGKLLKDAEAIADKVKVALPCIQAVIKNKDVFEHFDPSWSSLEQKQFWDEYSSVIYNIAVACTGQPKKFEWLKQLAMTADDIIQCKDDVVDVIDAGKEIPTFFKTFNTEIVKEFINDIVDMTKQCPAAIKEAEALAKSA